MTNAGDDSVVIMFQFDSEQAKAILDARTETVETATRIPKNQSEEDAQESMPNA